MKHEIDMNTWIRREHFNLFRTFDDPYYGVCVTVDCSIAYRKAKKLGISFFLYTLYLSLEAAQANTAFRYRIEDDKVFCYDQIDAGSTIARDNGTFGFVHLLYSAQLDEFIRQATAEVNRVKNRSDLQRSPANNVIRFSSLPWLDFTSLSHASNSLFKDTCPKISFGKMTEKEGKRTMPLAVHVHHALVDGIHIGQFIDTFQALLNQD